MNNLTFKENMNKKYGKKAAGVESNPERIILDLDVETTYKGGLPIIDPTKKITKITLNL
jgi:hypothetical protein